MYWPGLTGQNTYQNDHSVGTGLDLSLVPEKICLSDFSQFFIYLPMLKSQTVPRLIYQINVIRIPTYRI